MNFGNKIEFYTVWIASLFCMSVAIFYALEHTWHFFADHNYFFSPFADDILDSAVFSYPIAIGKASFWRVFDPYIDHRVAVEHIQELIDFVFTRGVQSLQPYRISALLWVNFFVFSWCVIFSNETLSRPIKIFLSGAYLILLFPGMSINNYVSTMQLTWPVIFLFTLLAFVSVSQYCKYHNHSKKSYLYIFLTVLCLNIVLYTFNVGVILWPIVLFILYKNNALKQHRFVWLASMIVNYYCYLQKDWILANFFSYTHQTTGTSFLLRPLEAFYYFSRVISVPFQAQAFDSYNVACLATGIYSVCLILLTLYHFLKKSKWTASDNIFFGYFVFVLFSLAVITIMRSTSGKQTLVEWRFLTSGLMFIFCSLMSLYLLPISSVYAKKVLHASLSLVASIWLTYCFISNDFKISGNTYDLGFYNQVFISQSVGIPINEAFLKASLIYQTCGTLAHHVAVNDVQKQYKKGPFSFWAAQQVGSTLNELSFKRGLSSDPAKISIVYDYRPERSAGMLLNVKLEDHGGDINKHWEVLFTNASGKIVGFAISAPYLQPLRSMFTSKQAPLVWRGAINTAKLHVGDIVYAWAASSSAKELYQLAAIKIPAPMAAQQQPTWVWQKTSHFGMS